MTRRRALAAAIGAGASLAAFPAAGYAEVLGRGPSNSDWLSGVLTIAPFLLGIVTGILVMSIWRATEQKRPEPPREAPDTNRVLQSMVEVMLATNSSVAELKAHVANLAGDVQSLTAQTRLREADSARPAEPQVKSFPADSFSAALAEQQTFRPPALFPPPDPMAEIMDEYRQAMEDEEQVDGFLFRRRALRAMRSGAGRLELVDSPTADLWVLPLESGGHALLLPSRRMLTRNFPALAANRGEGVRRELNSLFEIEFASLEKPVVVKPASTILDGQRARVVQPGLLRFPRQ